MWVYEVSSSSQCLCGLLLQLNWNQVSMFTCFLPFFLEHTESDGESDSPADLIRTCRPHRQRGGNTIPPGRTFGLLYRGTGWMNDAILKQMEEYKPWCVMSYWYTASELWIKGVLRKSSWILSHWPFLLFTLLLCWVVSNIFRLAADKSPLVSAGNFTLSYTFIIQELSFTPLIPSVLWSSSESQGDWTTFYSPLHHWLTELLVRSRFISNLLDLNGLIITAFIIIRPYSLTQKNYPACFLNGTSLAVRLMLVTVL